MDDKTEMSAKGPHTFARPKDSGDARERACRRCGRDKDDAWHHGLGH